MPAGDTPKKLNKAGVKYYNNLINELIANGIEPVVTMFHWDLPQPLQELGGMSNPDIIYHFKEYADVLLGLYGDRVKTWITFNEPALICESGYDNPTEAPFVNASGIGNYLCAHNILIANAHMYQLYQDKYKRPDGKMGIVLSNNFYWPKDPTNAADIKAANRALEFNVCIDVV